MILIFNIYRDRLARDEWKFLIYHIHSSTVTMQFQPEVSLTTPGMNVSSASKANRKVAPAVGSVKKDDCFR